MSERAKVRRLDPAAIGGVMSREVANFRTFWKGTTFSSLLEPVVYLLAFGLGLGATIVDRVGGLEYIEFVGTGMVATAVIFSSALPAMFGTFVKHHFQRTYDAILAAPVDVEELVTAEILWIAMRASVYGCFPLIVTFFFGLTPAWGMLSSRSSPSSPRARSLRSGSQSPRPPRRSTSSTTSRRCSSPRCSSSRAPSSRSISCRRAPRSPRTSTHCTTSSSWSARELRLRAARPGALRVARRARGRSMAARDQAHDPAPNRLSRDRLRAFAPGPAAPGP